MNYFLNEVVLPYQNYRGIILILLAITLFIPLVLDFLIEKEETSWLKNAMRITGSVFLIGIIVGTSFNLVKKKDWNFVFENNGVYLYDLDGSDHYLNGELIEFVPYSELTPYFYYVKNHPEMTFKLKDGEKFFKIEKRSLNGLAKFYKEVHKKNPELIERTVVRSGWIEFRLFKDKLNK